MSFVNKIKGWGQKGGADQSALDGDVAVADDYSPRRRLGRARRHRPAARRRRSGRRVRRDAAARRRRSAAVVDHLRGRAVRDRRLHRDPPAGRDSGAAPLGAALPLIGDRPAAEQQRILLAMLGLGLVGLIVADDPVVRLRRPRLGAGRCQRPGADAVAAARQVGLAGADRQPGGVPRSQGQRRGAGDATCAA